jgi:hypothetical protein
MDRSANYLKNLVGAPRFELGTSCAQVRRTISWKSFLFNLVFENKRVITKFGGGTVYEYVAPHAWSPPNFPLSEDQANCDIRAN